MVTSTVDDRTAADADAEVHADREPVDARRSPGKARSVPDAPAADDRAATVERLRQRLAAHVPAGARAIGGACELPVVIARCVNDPCADVFWDRADHALAYDLLLNRRPEARAARAPGRAASDAAGAAVARTLRRRAHPVVAVLDDAGLGTGLAFEAVNHVGHLQVPYVLVLVDTQTPRGRNAGAMARYLTRVRGHARYTDAKHLIEGALSRMPAGEQAVEVVRRLKNSVRELLVPTEMWEELLGFMYLGPVDVHNLGALGDVLQLALRARRPIVLHVTLDGGPAMRASQRDAAAARGARRRGALLQALEARLASDDRCLLVTTDTEGAFDTAALAEQAPERHFDLGRSGGHAALFAASLAAEGYRPVVVLGESSFASALAALMLDSDDWRGPVTLVHAGSGPSLRPPVRAALEAAGLAVCEPDAAGAWTQALDTASDHGRWTVLTAYEWT